jgi:hypothetical protein
MRSSRIAIRRMNGAHPAERRILVTPQRSFDATSLRLAAAGGPRTAGLETPGTLVHRGERVVPAAKGSFTFALRPSLCENPLTADRRDR